MDCYEQNLSQAIHCRHCKSALASIEQDLWEAIMLRICPRATVALCVAEYSTSYTTRAVSDSTHLVDLWIKNCVTVVRVWKVTRVKSCCLEANVLIMFTRLQQAEPVLCRVRYWSAYCSCASACPKLPWGLQVEVGKNNAGHLQSCAWSKTWRNGLC